MCRGTSHEITKVLRRVGSKRILGRRPASALIRRIAPKLGRRAPKKKLVSKVGQTPKQTVDIHHQRPPGWLPAWNALRFCISLSLPELIRGEHVGPEITSHLQRQHCSSSLEAIPFSVSCLGLGICTSEVVDGNLRFVPPSVSRHQSPTMTGRSNSVSRPGNQALLLGNGRFTANDTRWTGRPDSSRLTSGA